MEEQLIKRLITISRGLGIEVDALSKSLRGFSTKIWPPLLERLQAHFPFLDQERLTYGTTFTYDPRPKHGYSGSNLMNDLLSPFYLQEIKEDEEVHVIYPRVSTKTIFDSEETDKVMRDNVVSWIRDNSNGTVTSFRTLCQADLGYQVTCNLLDDFKESFLSQAIITFLVSNGMKVPAASYVEVPGRIIRQDLIMSIKYYPARDDNRAYCRDENRLRHLTGACLNRLISPRSKALKSRTKTATIFNHEDISMLKLRVPIAEQEGMLSVLILLDISNFTGSFANSWITLFSMALDTQNTLKYKYNVFGFGDHLLLASWHELLAIYLYLTVGYPCYVSDLDESHALPGGFLGVNANISAALLALSIIMKFVRDQARAEGINAHCQVGGDDSAIVLYGRKDAVENYIQIIQRALVDYVGLLKEFKVIDLANCCTDIVPDATFCKKRVRIEGGRGYYTISSEPSCPIHQSILPGCDISRLTKQAEAWYEFDRSLLLYERQNPTCFRQADCLRMAFLLKYPNVRPLRRRTGKTWTRTRLLQIEDYFVSELATQAIGDIGERKVWRFIALQSFRSKLTHALHNELVVMRKVSYRGMEVQALLHPSEEKYIEHHGSVEKVIVNPDPFYLRRILTIVRSSD